MIFYDIEQNTPEWEAMRVGKVGGSSIGLVMANLGKAFGPPAHQLAVKVALEQLDGMSRSSGYTNQHMERGHEQEPEARALYEETFFVEVDPGGYFDCGLTGVSPDGLVGDSGLIEIKSVVPHVHFETIKRGGFDPKYKWQLYLQIRDTGREWVDFVSYCADFVESKKLYTFRVYREELKLPFKDMAERLEQFESLVREKKEVILA